MPSIIIDAHAPVRRQREKIAKLEGKIFELRRQKEDAMEELARLLREAEEADAARETGR